jgi:hypothetical protein
MDMVQITIIAAAWIPALMRWPVERRGSRLLYHVLQAIAIFMVFWTAWRLTVSGSSCKE